MAFEFRPATRENVGLLIGLSGGSGSGKTWSAMLLAKGISGDKPFCVIDSEAGRAKHYADYFRFDHGDLMPKFTPRSYAEAITAADKAGYPAIVVDSASHEYAGEGGVLEMQEEEIERLAKGDDRRRETMKMASWIKPKMEHKKFVQKILQIRAHLILCFRAEPKIEAVKDEHGKLQWREKQSLVGINGWIPVCEKNMPYELTVSFLLMADRPGVPIPIKLQEQHKALFPLDQPITEESGARLAAWAHGAKTKQASLDEATTSVWLKRIADAKTRQDLDTIGDEIKAAKAMLKAGQLTALRDAIKGKSKTVPKRIQGTVQQSDIRWS